MARRRTRTNKDGHKYTIETPIVHEYIIFLSTPRSERPDDEKSVEGFMTKHDIKSGQSLANYRNIKGFMAEVTRRKVDLMVTTAEDGLYRRAKGIKITEQALDRNGGEHELEKELAPETAASSKLMEIFGGHVPRSKVEVEVEATLRDKWIKAARNAGKEKPKQ